MVSMLIKFYTPMMLMLRLPTMLKDVSITTLRVSYDGTWPDKQTQRCVKLLQASIATGHRNVAISALLVGVILEIRVTASRRLGQASFHAKQLCELTFDV
jgi:hypothetical protein